MSAIADGALIVSRVPPVTFANSWSMAFLVVVRFAALAAALVLPAEALESSPPWLAPAALSAAAPIAMLVACSDSDHNCADVLRNPSRMGFGFSDSSFDGS